MKNGYQGQTEVFLELFTLLEKRTYIKKNSSALLTQLDDLAVVLAGSENFHFNIRLHHPHIPCKFLARNDVIFEIKY